MPRPRTMRREAEEPEPEGSAETVAIDDDELELIDLPQPTAAVTGIGPVGDDPMPQEMLEAIAEMKERSDDLMKQAADLLADIACIERAHVVLQRRRAERQLHA